MIKPTTVSKIIIAFIGLTIIAIIINSFSTSYNKMSFKVSFNISDVKQEKNIDEEKINIQENKKENNQKVENNYNFDWKINIPKINLVAEIKEGTTKEIMDKYVGHFEETQIEYGNVGLAGHNRGYPVNYFQDLKMLEIGDEIIYSHLDFEMAYEVETIEIIENTNWNYLKNTQDNRITLITCVENEPKYRRCIQAIEKIEREEF